MNNIKSRDVVFANGKDWTAVEHLALLSRCNHSIITLGTYSWWSGWLAGGDVIYYKRYLRPNSKDYFGDEYYPYHWMGL